MGIFTAASVTKNVVVCGGHFRGEDYISGDTMEFRMVFRRKDRVRLIPCAVPSVRSVLWTSAASVTSAGGEITDRANTHSARRKREMYTASYCN